MDKQIDRQTDRQIDRQIDRQPDRYIDRQIGRQIDRQIDNQIDRQIDKQIDRSINLYIYISTKVIQTHVVHSFLLLSELFSWGLLGMSTIPGYCEFKYLKQPTISQVWATNMHISYIHIHVIIPPQTGKNIGIIYMSGCTISLSHFCC